MALLTITSLKSYINADVDDVALQGMMDAADAEITRIAGPHEGAITIVREGGYPMLSISRPVDDAETITIVETVGETSTTLAANDYRVRLGGFAIERRKGGDNPRSTWAKEVSVTYTPLDDIPIRRLVLINLVKIELTFSGYTQERIGEIQLQAGDYHEQKRRMLGLLNPRGAMPEVV